MFRRRRGWGRFNQVRAVNNTLRLLLHDAQEDNTKLFDELEAEWQRMEAARCKNCGRVDEVHPGAGHFCPNYEPTRKA